MAKYTMELYKLTEDTNDRHPVNLTRLENECMSSYELPYGYASDEIRHKINEKILHHFYFREIGFETPKMFRLQFKWRLEEIMPKYGQMLKLQTELLSDEPLHPGKYKWMLGKVDNTTEKHTGTDRTEFGKTLTKSGDYTDIACDENGNTPHGQETLQSTRQSYTTATAHQGIDNENPEKNISLHIDGSVFNNQQYATNHDLSYDEVTVTTNDDSGDPDKNSVKTITKGGRVVEYDDLKDTEGGDQKFIHGHTIDRTGHKDVDALDVLERFPDAFMNIYAMIFNDLEPLFMGIF